MILFAGDLHGHVFHLMVALRALRQREGIRPDMVIQLGDLQAFPDPAGAGLLENHFVQSDAAELDFSRLLKAEGGLARAIHRFRDVPSTSSGATTRTTNGF